MGREIVNVEAAINDLATKYVQQLEAEVVHHLIIIEQNHDADRHVYDDLIQHKRLKIEFPTNNVYC